MKTAFALQFVLLALLVPALGAPSDAQKEPDNKLTASYYDFSSGKYGVDVNLRHTFKTSTAWIGGYQESSGFDQARVGYEYDYRRDWLSVIPSALAATRGFVGASVYAEAGKKIYAIGGAGRTNLRPYWNLGFDPNDYIQFGLGFRDHDVNTVSAYAIRDNRLGTHQTNTHFVARRHFAEDWRLTLDVVREQGRGDNDIHVHAWAATATVDWRRWFMRIARDPNVNYTADRQVRVGGGFRF